MDAKEAVGRCRVPDVCSATCWGDFPAEYLVDCRVEYSASFQVECLDCFQAEVRVGLMEPTDVLMVAREQMVATMESKVARSVEKVSMVD
ncbi:hypothetical protein [Thalassoglobus neptunius]|uniref:hypothetical protein n=1 Tax=Thalassoglobus neptunius TaxID=1938619 RepID=UPI0018D22B86|nr:hypothetical protein [Thalassoglobus neptunius]